MSDSSEPQSELPGPARAVYRTVTPPYRPRGESSMDAVGWGILLGIVVLVLPLLPFLVAVWLLTKLIDAVVRRAGEDEDASAE
jgi:hypothetical protein